MGFKSTAFGQNPIQLSPRSRVKGIPMITMEPDGSQERFFRRKCIPLTTFFILVASFLMIGFGAGMIATDKTHTAISSLPLQTAPILLLSAGILSFLLACVGLYWWIKKILLEDMGASLKLFVCLLVVASILALVAGSLGLHYIKKLNNGFEAELKEKIAMYGKTGRYEILMNIDKLQKEDKCCGVINYADWRHTTYGGGRYDKVPDSCCKAEEHACGFEFQIDKINHKGCYSIALERMKKSLKLVGFGGIFCGIIEIILWITLLYVCHRGTKISSNQHHISYRKKTDSPAEEMAMKYDKEITHEEGADEPELKGSDLLSSKDNQGSITSPSSLEEKSFTPEQKAP